jgi:hypothetical protein
MWQCQAHGYVYNKSRADNISKSSYFPACAFMFYCSIPDLHGFALANNRAGLGDRDVLGLGTWFV